MTQNSIKSYFLSTDNETTDNFPFPKLDGFFQGNHVKAPQIGFQGINTFDDQQQFQPYFNPRMPPLQYNNIPLNSTGGYFNGGGGGGFSNIFSSGGGGGGGGGGGLGGIASLLGGGEFGGIAQGIGEGGQAISSLFGTIGTLLGDKDKLDFQKDQLQSNEQIADWEIGLGHHREDDDFKIKKQIENELDKEIGFSTENERRDDKEKHLIDSANIDFRKKFYNSKSKLR